MKKKNRFLYILIFILYISCKSIETGWASNSSCNLKRIVEIDEETQEQKINEAELDCLTQIINTQETGKHKNKFLQFGELKFI